MFVTVGMSQQAVAAFTKANLVKEAIDSCVSLNQVKAILKLHPVISLYSNVYQEHGGTKGSMR